MWSAKTNVEAVGQPAAHHTCYTSRQNGAERHKDAQTVLTTVGKGDKLYVWGFLLLSFHFSLLHESEG